MDDARERLRRYLEQRKDFGESELLLDSMSVDDLMRTLGATGKNASLKSSGRSSNQPGGWREVLAAQDVTPDAVERTPRGAASSPTSQQPAQVERKLISDSEIMEMVGLDAVAGAVESCMRCPLYRTANRGVPGAGNPQAKLVCIGEGPGANEDEQGLPFVGAAGQLLTKILAAVDLGRDDVFITNVVKHRPPGNRNPANEEIEACTPYLIRQLEIIKPKVIVALGTFAAQTLLNTKTPIGKLRGEVHRFHGIPVVVTYHPAALLRNSAWKRPTWEDVKLARRILDSPSRS